MHIKSSTYRYTDHSQTGEMNENSHEIPNQRLEAKISKNHSLLPSVRTAKLPVKLYAILSNPDYSDIITWMHHGRSWKVLSQKRFLDVVVPVYFEYSNYNSFNRLVNAWGFRKTCKKSPDGCSYFHELFLRGMPHLHKSMRRLASKEKKVPMHPNAEPNFYELSKFRPLPALTLIPNVALGNQQTNARTINNKPIIDASFRKNCAHNTNTGDTFTQQDFDARVQLFLQMICMAQSISHLKNDKEPHSNVHEFFARQTNLPNNNIFAQQQLEYQSQVQDQRYQGLLTAIHHIEKINSSLE
eukprot:CAMPEP_0194388056 /NCGR_PEP_ID=MMETSP0174-20130528/96196_1 /TAXON_ID=216777 /ORGANISM="Proboscia alata, Strain PI-D3" /LENGTH=298 /DNA_ID=CAMNT_0039178917 /DNA_START=39 /DNA_END=935 /DNA_ORIENTATION=-